ncbi:hypothetical protein [Mariniblastus fucicola]|uniref:hypothetical protein n=1 Tax=Mariniblastus fucicola TaxID=980251 RepID=UPI0012FAA763|nr:hypothetical protein [Mariniblastus fucicola]
MNRDDSNAVRRLSRVAAADMATRLPRDWLAKQDLNNAIADLVTGNVEWDG